VTAFELRRRSEAKTPLSDVIEGTDAAVNAPDSSRLLASPPGLGLRQPSGAFPGFQSGGGPPQSKTLPRGAATRVNEQRLGVLQSSGALTG